MKTFEVSVDVSKYITVKAKSKEEARQIAIEKDKWGEIDLSDEEKIIGEDIQEL